MRTLSIRLHSRSTPDHSRNIHRTKDSILPRNTRACERITYLSVFHVVEAEYFAFQILDSRLKPTVT